MRLHGLLLLLLLSSTGAICKVAGRQQQPRWAQEQRPKQQSKPCGGQSQTCCPACKDGRPDEECSERSCKGDLACLMFAARDSLVPDGTTHFPMLCLPTPDDCGAKDQPCCFNSDPTSDAGRCGSGLTCIVTGNYGYNNLLMYNKLLKDPKLVRSREVMGTCRKLTTSDCGKLWFPCGAAARKLGCNESAVVCGTGAYCASPADTMLAAPRCFPVPVRCGQTNNACCPANKDSTTRERWLQDGTTAVPYCTDGKSFCVWNYPDYADYGLAALSSGAGGRQLFWDGYFQRGYGISRCAPVPAACGNPGEPCCPSMIDQRLSGMIHNRQFKYQPCNYRAAGKLGIYCAGAWRSELLTPGVKLGTCTLNTPDCGKLGKKCCVEDVARVGPLSLCEEGKPPGLHYCTKAGNICSKCPKVLVTPEQKESCMGIGGPPIDLDSPPQQEQQMQWQQQQQQPPERGSPSGRPEPGQSWSVQWPPQQQQPPAIQQQWGVRFPNPLQQPGASGSQQQQQQLPPDPEMWQQQQQQQQRMRPPSKPDPDDDPLMDPTG